MLYLSFGSISSSRGISLYHRSIALAVIPPFFWSAALTVSTTRSTSLNRFRCRRFWGAESRHGIFLQHLLALSEIRSTRSSPEQAA